ncbi:hypothetical protein [Azospirillum sp. B510]|uniref:hypothetical protein n=1 Tax=Azospirillum sp. (strain B510) TaxID=137722 RepID=UPI0011D1557C|nr:hypothetical protein [Azospirillum sp. B510]
MIPAPPPRLRPLLALAVLLAAGACAPSDPRGDQPGRASDSAPNSTQAFPPIHTETFIPGGGRRTWSGIQADQNQADQSRADRQANRGSDRDSNDTGQPPPKRRRGSSSPPPDPAALPQPPRPVPLPPPPSSQSATDAFKRDLIRPEVDRMRTDDAIGRLDPLGQRDLMRRENDLRQWGDPLAR